MKQVNTELILQKMVYTKSLENSVNLSVARSFNILKITSIFCNY